MNGFRQDIVHDHFGIHEIPVFKFLSFSIL